MFKTALKAICSAASVLLFATTPLQASVLVDITGGNAANCGGCGVVGTTFGYRFQLTNNYVIDGLGVWDENADGLQAPAMTGLWDSTGALLASVLATNAGDVEVSAITSGRWLIQDVSALTLGPGVYFIGSQYFTQTSEARLNSTPVTAAGITILGGVQNTVNSGFSVPNQAAGLIIFGPTMREADAAVPLPSGLLLSALGLAALAGARRQRRAA